MLFGGYQGSFAQKWGIIRLIVDRFQLDSIFSLNAQRKDIGEKKTAPLQSARGLREVCEAVRGGEHLRDLFLAVHFQLLALQCQRRLTVSLALPVKRRESPSYLASKTALPCPLVASCERMDSRFRENEGWWVAMRSWW